VPPSPPGPSLDPFLSNKNLFDAPQIRLGQPNNLKDWTLLDGLKPVVGHNQQGRMDRFLGPSNCAGPIIHFQSRLKGNKKHDYALRLEEHDKSLL
jgi:hypothetical protein